MKWDSLRYSMGNLSIPSLMCISSDHQSECLQRDPYWGQEVVVLRLWWHILESLAPLDVAPVVLRVELYRMHIMWNLINEMRHRKMKENHLKHRFSSSCITVCSCFRPWTLPPLRLNRMTVSAKCYHFDRSANPVLR